MTEPELPECHEGEKAGEQFKDALQAIFRAGRDVDVQSGVNQRQAPSGGPDRSASGTSPGARRPETAPA